MGNLPVGFQFTRIEEAVRNKYEGGGCFAITVTEIGRTGGTGKLLYVYLSRRLYCSSGVSYNINYC